MLATPFSIIEVNANCYFGHGGPNDLSLTKQLFMEFLYKCKMTYMLFIFDDIFDVKEDVHKLWRDQYIVPKTLYGVYFLQELNRHYKEI